MMSLGNDGRRQRRENVGRGRRRLDACGSGLVTRHRAFLLLACAAVALLAGCRRETEPPRHLLLVTFDTLRADHMSLVGYPRQTTPRLEEFADGGLSFERAFAQWPKTGTSFASIFSGLYPQTTGLTHRAALLLPSSLPILPELLQSQGFTTVAVVSNPVLSKELGWSRNFDEYLQTWTDTSSNDPFHYRPQINALRVNELALDLLDRHREDERLFAWIHYSDPHAPYLLPEGRENPFEGDAWFADGPDLEPDLAGTRGRAIPGVSSLREYVSLYDANVLVADEAAGQLLDHAESLGLLEDAAVAITADHGESLGEHRLFFEHGPLPHDPGVHVPLVLRGTGVPAGTTLSGPVALVDLLPTLCGWLNVICPEGDGESLARFYDGRPVGQAALAFSEAGHRPNHFRMVWDERFKLVYRSLRKASFPDPDATFELFDLTTDPQERRNVIDDFPEDARRLQRALVDWVRSARKPGEDDSPLSPAQKQALEAMGYATQ